MALNVLKVFSPQTLDAVLAGPGLSNRLFVFTGIAEIEFSALGNNKLVHDVVELVLSDWHGDIHLDLENTELTTAVWPASMHADDDATQVTWAVDDAFAFVTEEDRPKLRVIVAVQGDKGVLSRIGYEVFARTTSIPIKSFDVREVLRPVPELVISLVLSQNAVGKGEDIYLTSLDSRLTLPFKVTVPAGSDTLASAGIVLHLESFPVGDTLVHVKASNAVSEKTASTIIHRAV
jgi:hypothetical protein